VSSTKDQNMRGGGGSSFNNPARKTSLFVHMKRKTSNKNNNEFVPKKDHKKLKADNSFDSDFDSDEDKLSGMLKGGSGNLTRKHDPIRRTSSQILINQQVGIAHEMIDDSFAGGIE